MLILEIAAGVVLGKLAWKIFKAPFIFLGAYFEDKQKEIEEKSIL